MTTKTKRRLIIVPLIVLVVLIAAYLAAGYAIYEIMVGIEPRCESAFMENRRDNSPAGFLANFSNEDDLVVDSEPYEVAEYDVVEFPAREDGTRIEAWFIPATTPTDDVVIVVHGVYVCRKAPTPLLAGGMLANNGYDVLMLDLRNHGNSEITTGRTSLGIEEHRDVLGAYDWLIEQGYAPEDIGVAGISLGAATSILAFGEEEGIAALWADSSFTDGERLLDTQLPLNGAPAFLKFSVLMVGRVQGFDLQGDSPLAAMQHYNGRPVYITHGTADDWIDVSDAYLLYDATDQTAEMWIIEGMGHVEGMFQYPEEYENRMVAFFDAALKSD